MKPILLRNSLLGRYGYSPEMTTGPSARAPITKRPKTPAQKSRNSAVAGFQGLLWYR